MISVLLHDKRVKGNAPPGPRAKETWSATLAVDTTDSLGFVLGWVRSQLNRFDYIDELHLYAHGDATDIKGIQFGGDNITLDNVHEWGYVSGCIEEIHVLACNAAAAGDGEKLCSQLAGYANAWVRASPTKQLYDSFVDINFGAWEGPVYWWQPDGTFYGPD